MRIAFVYDAVYPCVKGGAKKVAYVLNITPDGLFM